MKEINPIYKVTIVYPNGSIEKDDFCLEPKKGETFLADDEKVYIIVDSALTCCVSDENRTINYYVIYVELYHTSLVGVTQVKIISPKFGGSDAADAIEKELNNFLYNNRHTHEIMNIKYMQFGVAVTYRIRNQFDVMKNKALEKSYQNEGKRIDVDYKGCKYSFNKGGIL